MLQYGIDALRTYKAGEFGPLCTFERLGGLYSFANGFPADRQYSLKDIKLIEEDP
jgi:hypothetical protein